MKDEVSGLPLCKKTSCSMELKSKERTSLSPFKLKEDLVLEVRMRQKFLFSKEKYVH